jgi:hypothetical protein
MKGNNDTAKALLAATTSMSQAEIDRRYRVFGPRSTNTGPMCRPRQTRLRDTAAAMGHLSQRLDCWSRRRSWLLGAGHVHRVHHLRRYETATARPL